jgi:hypothetical protein
MVVASSRAMEPSCRRRLLTCHSSSTSTAPASRSRASRFGEHPYASTALSYNNMGRVANGLVRQHPPPAGRCASAERPTGVLGISQLGPVSRRSSAGRIVVLGPSRPDSRSCTGSPRLVELPDLLDHPDDPTGPVWIRRDRRRIQPEQARSVWSRPDRRRAPGYGSGGWSSDPSRRASSRTGMLVESCGSSAHAWDRATASTAWTTAATTSRQRGLDYPGRSKTGTGVAGSRATR